MNVLLTFFSNPSGRILLPLVMDAAAIEAMITQRVNAALANMEEQRGNQRACTYKDFSNCKPRPFHGDGGVIDLTRWFEKMESVFEMCNCPAGSKVKFAASTFANSALSWWNGHVSTMGIAQANAMSWDDLKNMMREEYCPRSEIQNLEQEFWNLKMQGSDLVAYNHRFSDLANLCPGMVTPEHKMIERYIWGLVPQIQGNVVASRPNTLLSAKTIAQGLTDQLVRHGILEKKPEPSSRSSNKRKRWDKKEGESGQDSQNEQQAVVLNAVITPITQAPSQKSYGGKLPKCGKCSYHHVGDCRQCTNCKRNGHTAPYCRMPTQATSPETNTGISKTCFECGSTGHFKKNCPKLKKDGN